jgi:antirestriction protein ArdC
MPDLSRFDDNVSYYGVAGHELCHWTGAPSRLARPMSFDHKSEEYAFEELIAEIGASYLAADWQIEITPREDHAAYLQSWLKALRNNKKMIFRAASAAAKACAYLHGLQPKGERT